MFAVFIFIERDIVALAGFKLALSSWLYRHINDCLILTSDILLFFFPSVHVL